MLLRQYYFYEISVPKISIQKIHIDSPLQIAEKFLTLLKKSESLRFIGVFFANYIWNFPNNQDRE